MILGTYLALKGKHNSSACSSRSKRRASRMYITDIYITTISIKTGITYNRLVNNLAPLARKLDDQVDPCFCIDRRVWELLKLAHEKQLEEPQTIYDLRSPWESLMVRFVV